MIFSHGIICNESYLKVVSIIESIVFLREDIVRKTEKMKDRLFLHGCIPYWVNRIYWCLSCIAFFCVLFSHSFLFYFFIIALRSYS
jgi:hypothetical protein